MCFLPQASRNKKKEKKKRKKKEKESLGTCQIYDKLYMKFTMIEMLSDCTKWSSKVTIQEQQHIFPTFEHNLYLMHSEFINTKIISHQKLHQELQAEFVKSTRLPHIAVLFIF